jgi:hypothetical protein
MVGGIIPLRRATSSRYDGRLEQESARWIKKLQQQTLLVQFAPVSVPKTKFGNNGGEVHRRPALMRCNLRAG